MREELLGALMLLALFGALIGLAEALARKTALDPEWSRKLVHLGGGLGCLLFPLLLGSPWTVLLLALCFGGVFWLAERKRWLKCLCRVSRRSNGSIYYPFAIAGLFWASADHYGLYASAVLVLTVSDTAAALVGSRYGRIRYRTGGVEEHKSLEGSLAFWSLTFLVVYFPLTLGNGAEPVHALFAAFLAATMLTAVEAVAIGGRDNLYVPILASFILLKVVTKPAAELAMQSVSMVVLFGLMFALNRYGRMLRTKALMMMAIIVYGVWSLGSVDWAVPLLVAFAWFTLVFSVTGGQQRRTRAYRRMAVLAAPAAVLVLAANLTGAFSYAYGPFLGAVLVPLVWAVVLHLNANPTFASWRWTARQAGAALCSAAVVLAGPVLMRRAPDANSVVLIAAVALLSAWLGLGLTLLWPRVTVYGAAQAVFSAPCEGDSPIFAAEMEDHWAKTPFVPRKLGQSPRERLRPRFAGSAAVVTATCVAIGLIAGGQSAGWLSCWRPMLWADVYYRDVDVLFPLPSNRPAGPGDVR